MNIRTEFIEYKLDNLVMEGFIAVSESNATSQPLVLIIHDWTGNRAFVQEKARYFAKQEFVAFAVDLYGVGKRGDDANRPLNEKLIGELLQDRSVIVPRLHAALECALKNANIDNEKIMLIGFCLGGMSALDFARSGADIAGVICIHGLLEPHEPENNKKISAKILVVHGHDDPNAKPHLVLAFETEMNNCDADWQLHVFGNTYHAFTNSLANEPNRGLIYNPAANSRTWALVRAFTDELFA